ncbi:uncharacterized protein yc1106_10058 [Curvularia clavata]|uniref:Exosome complex protein n=1 Tax=Curvularia clavata TaxID=95742 RepID=A0A9Q8ZHH6_CURCL|nr:uncharacterized protein yc1106_10058 [Curvularia clavata]
MDPQTNLPDLIEDLEVDIDDLTTALEPLLSKPLHTTASSLPLLDKAKLYCLAAYTIESLLFASLTASGVNATEHAIFKEIARLRQYNTKIKEIEDRGIKGSAEGRARLDVAAAGRFIKHGLAGNDKYDLERQERMAKERARAHLKAAQINKKFDDEAVQAVTPQKRLAEEEEEEGDEEEQILDGIEDTPASKKPRVEDNEAAAQQQQQESKKRSKKDKKTEDARGTPSMRGSRKNKKSHLSSRNTQVEDANDDDNDDDDVEEQEQEQVGVPDQAPKTRSETFSALLDGSHKQKKEKATGKKGGKKGGKGRGK